MFSCVAIVGKNNEPLFLKSFAKAPPSAANTPAPLVASSLPGLQTPLPAARDALATTSTGPSSTASESDLKYHYIVHTALDVVEEKATTVTKSSGELFLGLLYPAEEFKVYGYVTNTRIKLITVWEEGNPILRDNDIRTFFRRLHDAYADMLCNPFYVVGEKISAPSFEKLVSVLNMVA